MGSVLNTRVIGPSGNIKPIPIYSPIPPTFSPILKVTINTSSGEIDVTDSIVQASFNVGVISGTSNTVGDFNLTFIDPNQTNLNLTSLFDDIYLYADYGTTASTKRFRFKVENKSFVDFNTTLSGRGIGMILADKSIIYTSSASENKSTTLINILTANFSNITDFSQIETDTTQVLKNYAETPTVDIIQELCGTTKFFYLDKDLVPHFFTKGTQINSSEAINNINLVQVKDNASNAEQIYTRVRVYGQSEGGIPIIATSNIGTTNTGGINKDYIINDNSITTSTQAQEVADTEASNYTNSKRIGDLVVFLLPNLTPGDSLFVGLPEHNLDPSYYNIQQFSINIDNQGNYVYTTTFTIEQKRINTPIILQSLNQKQTDLAQNDNPHNLNHSKIITFDTNSGTHTGTTINEGYLKVVSGGSTGFWKSDIITLTDDLAALEIRFYGDLLVGDYQSTTSTLWYSTNGEATWHLNPISGEVTSVPAGKDLGVKVELNQSTAKVKRIGIYYNLVSD